MPQKPKKRPQQSINMDTIINLQNAETAMTTFIKYYKGIELVPEEEWKHFFTSLLTDLPYTFRISENKCGVNNVLEGKPGVLGQSEVLKEFLKNNIFPQLAGVKVDDVPFEISPISWYPRQLGWKTNISKKLFFSSTELKPLNKFVRQEEHASFVANKEMSSMIPPLLVDINPNHKVLELCSAPGLQTLQLLEQLNSSKKSGDGFLVTNDVDARFNFRRFSGVNVLCCHEDPKKFPDLYVTEEHTAESKVLYDRIFIDAPTSDDGNMRSNKKLRAGWTVTKAMKNHKDLKPLLRRGLELLELNGQLVYITNSINPIENEAVVAALLKEASGTVELVDVKRRIPDFHIRPGMSNWKVMSQGQVFYETFESAPLWFQKENENTLFPPSIEDAGTLNLDRCLRVMPHDNDTGAFFVAVFTKFGSLPWQKEAEEEEMDTVDVKKEASESSDANKKKCPYNLPIRVDVNVCVSEIEWTTEITDEALNTSETMEHSTFELAPMKISKSCIPLWLQKKMQEQSCRYEDVTPTDPNWVTYRDMFDIKKGNPLPNMLRYVQDGKFSLYYYVNSNIKTLIKCNPDVAKKVKGQCGGLLMFRAGDSVPMAVKSIMPVIQHVNKRLFPITRVDLIHLLENKEVVFKDLSDKLKKELEALSDNGTVYFIYEPKGKQADPKCPIVISRERYQTYVRSESAIRSESQHCLRLCGVDPNSMEGEDEEEEPME